ncbi:hypothetical protein DFH09DRAFT_1321269 [Mycena vulgaris]|nr:hypothetical protein DFH09DRAFT_1321269 [Mycena vulgaris]
MSSSTSALPYSSIAPVPVMQLLIPMPVPRTSNAPYFDGKGVRAFLNLILLHGANAGITDADALVDFIVRYSSDRVRAIIQYHEELDPDEPNRTWAKAHEQMLLFFGCSDEDRRCTEQELLDFCREQSAKPPFGTKLEIEQYLHGFQYIAGPLMKAREITTAKRDFYFVSGIPSVIKEWFIARVPEHQRTRSNPVPLADSLQILYNYFDPNALFPDLWEHLQKSSERINSPAPHASYSSSSISTQSNSLPQAIRPSLSSATFVQSAPTPSSQEPLRATVPIAPAPVSPSTMATIEWQYPLSAKIEKVTSDIDPTDAVYQDSDAEAIPKVPPSSNLHDARANEAEFNSDEPYLDQRYAENSVYFCWNNEATDRVSGCTIEGSLAEAPIFQDSPELSVQLNRGSPDFTPSTYAAPNEPKSSVDREAEIRFELCVALERCLKGLVPNLDESHMSTVDFCGDPSASTSSDSGVESLFDSVPTPETQMDVRDDSLSSCTSLEDSDDFDSPIATIQASRATLFETRNTNLEATPEPDFFAVLTPEMREALESYFASCVPEHIEPEISSIPYPTAFDAGATTGTESEPWNDSTTLDSPTYDHSCALSESGFTDNASDLQQNLCTSLQFPPGETNTSEPFRTESSSPCACYIDYFVPELFEPSLDPALEQVSKRQALLECLEPIGDPPSYLESDYDIQRPQIPSNSRFKAEHRFAILFLISVALKFIPDRVIFSIVLAILSAMQAVSIFTHNLESSPSSHSKRSPHQLELTELAIQHYATTIPSVLHLGFETLANVLEPTIFLECAESVYDAASYSDFFQHVRTVFAPSSHRVTAECLLAIVVWFVASVKFLFRVISSTTCATLSCTLNFCFIPDSDPTLPRRDLQLNELAAETSAPAELSPLNDTHDNQHNLRTSFEFYTEHPSKTEPFQRAEPQPFFPCASYVDYFVPELFELNSDCVSKTDLHPLERIEPEDDPPSYEQSISTPHSSFTYARPRLKAEYLRFILSSISAYLDSVLLLLFEILSKFSVINQDAPSIDIQFSTENEFSDFRDAAPHTVKLSTQKIAEIHAEPVPPDKNSKSTCRGLSSQFHLESLVLFPSSTQVLEFSQQGAFETDTEPVPPDRS